LWIASRGAGSEPIALLWGLAEDRENFKTRFKGEDTDHGLGIEPGGSKDNDRFDNLPDFFTIGFGLVRFVGIHDEFVID
jgi:hypothetical protein